MTAQDRYVLDLEDFKAVRVECATCGAALVVDIANWNSILSTCPTGCGTQWFPLDGEPFQTLNKLRVGLTQTIQKMHDQRGFRLRFEITPPSRG